MEFARNETISDLLDEIQLTRRQPNTRQPSNRSSQRCGCGVCTTCQDNARWERVFNEKFADPLYYLPREIKRGSSLAG